MPSSGEAFLDYELCFLLSNKSLSTSDNTGPVRILSINDSSKSERALSTIAMM